MKRSGFFLRIAIPVVLLLTPLCSKAQYSHLYYHCQRDTVIYDAETYYHSWWEFENSLSTQKIYHIQSHPLPANKLLLYHFTDTPLQVVGLAIIPPPIIPPAFSNDPYYYYDTTVLREYLYLCEAGNDTTYELAKVRWLPADTSRFIKIRHTEVSGLDKTLTIWRYMTSDDGSYGQFCCGGDPYSHVINVAEYYFESPITVTDSFYVGCSNISFNPAQDAAFAGRYYPAQHYMMALQTMPKDCKGNVRYNTMEEFFEDTVCNIQWPAIWECHWNDPTYSYPNGRPYLSDIFSDGIYYHTSPYFPLIFPIVMVDTTVPPRSYCPKVENLQLSSDSVGCVSLSWDAFINHRNGYNIFYGPRNLPESRWNTLYTEDNFVRVCDLDSNLFYQFRVAPICDSLQNSAQWNTASVIRPTGDGSTKITDPSALARHTTVSPNPTSGNVHLHSDYVVTSIDLYDAQGRHLDNYPYPGFDSDINLSPLPDGLYLLVINTSNGITTKQVLKR